MSKKTMQEVLYWSRRRIKRLRKDDVQMNWKERMEAIFDYIEENLTQEIYLQEIAKLAGCSEYNIQRVFSFIMDISLAEYIRNRRLSEAAAEIRTGTRIIDTAVKYGYNSQEAFSRAFLKFHGINPGELREGQYSFVFYPRPKLKNTEVDVKMNNESKEFLLTRSMSAEQFKHRAPSPITLNFPVSMWSYMEYMGHNADTMRNYTLIANLCGDTCGKGLELTGSEEIMQTLNLFGYSCEVFSTRQSDSNYLPEKALTDKIIEQLTVNQRPVIAVNMVDCCFGGVVIGYKDNGNCLVNWGFFPFDSSENPMPVITDCIDWYEKTEKVIFVGDRTENNSSIFEIYTTALKKVSEYLGTSENLANSLFYCMWRQHLKEMDTELPDDFTIVDPMWCDFAEKRFYAGQLMLQLMEYLPEFDSELVSLWKIFGENINDLMYDYIAQVDLKPGENVQTMNMDKLRDPAVRQRMCDIISLCEEEEKKAADIIVEIVNKLNIKP